jgi:hypothetical protein
MPAYRHKKRPLLTTHKGRVLPHTIVLVQTADSAAVKVNLIGMSIAGRVGFVKAKRTLPWLFQGQEFYA